MQVQVVATNSDISKTACLVVPVFEGTAIPDGLPLETARIIKALGTKGIFSGKVRESYFLPSAEQSILLLGLGKADVLTPEKVRRAAGTAALALKSNRVQELALRLPTLPSTEAREGEAFVAAFLDGLLLGQYDFDAYMSRKESDPRPVKVESVTVVVAAGSEVAALETACRRAVVTCVAVNGARHLANTPPNELTPTALAEFACGIAEKSPPLPHALPEGEGTGPGLGTGKCCECVVLDQLQMASLGMNALLGVSLGSAQPPKLIILTYRHSTEAKTIAMVGKGVTFDSGGISIKPAQSMHEMKYDMCGAAAVLCAMMALVELKPEVNVVCVVPATENMTGDAAQRPGDIVRAYNGVTIEVLNTDAEGRLILADALAYTVDKYKPDVMVDLATLTGACVVALGGYRAGLFANDEVLAAELLQAGDTSGDLLWRLPMGEDYEKLIESPHADVANIGPKGEAGATMGAEFLKKFVGETPWAHLDIAGTAWGAQNISYLDPKHASGYGVRLLVEWVMGQGHK